MSKSNRKKQTGNFVRGVREEAALQAYTIALGYVMTRDRDQAIRLLEERIDYSRKELREVNARRVAAHEAKGTGA